MLQYAEKSIFRRAPEPQKRSAGGKYAFPHTDNRPQSIVQRRLVDGLGNMNAATFTIQKKENRTGLPDTLKSGIENLSGHSMDDVKVYYNSPHPAQLHAHAYAQGTEIHVAPGQEKHLPHEAWHVVQQKRGRVKAGKELQLKEDAPTDGEVVQRVAYANAPGTFDNILTFSGIKDQFDKLGDEYADKRADEDEQGMNQIAGQVRTLWDTHVRTQHPERVGQFFSRGKAAMDTLITPAFDDLRIITALPPPLSADTVHLDIGNGFDKLKYLLAQKKLSISGAGFRQFINEQMAHFAALRQKLGQEPGVLNQLWDGDPGQTSIAFKPLGADEHGYAPPTRLDMKQGQKEKSLVYKARPGEVDKMVTDLFAQLNRYLHGEIKLPEYRQALFRDKQLLSEFISGPRLDSLIALQSGAGSEPSLDALSADPDKQKSHEERRRPEERAKIDANIRMLEAIAKSIGLTDLHEENLILDRERGQVVPIDLEAFTTGKPQETGLYGTEANAPDTSSMIPADAYPSIEDFKAKLDYVERRFVPVPTGELHSMMEMQPPDAVASRIGKSLEENNFIVNGNQLLSYVDACKSHHPMAIPSFTVQHGEVFSSPVMGGKIIVARRREEKSQGENLAWAEIDPLIAHYRPLLAKADDLEFKDYYRNPFKRIIVQLLSPETGTVSLLRSMVSKRAHAYEYVFITAPLDSYEQSLNRDKQDIGKEWMQDSAKDWAEKAEEVIMAFRAAVTRIKSKLPDDRK